MDTAKVINIIIAIFLPPVSVFLACGFGTEFVVDLVLTICAFFPGMLYALYLVFKNQ
ncbi:PMP3 (YDR276C) [Zygosaccharomyces parabailii]|nr:PMP3 (YDR276C) [Zygosaccharomyces parabailii]AQZ14885.1 PMP3 (YDR276C) [Zygosaccharomyces parabailii]